MDKVVILHHSNVGLPNNIKTNQSLASYTHLLNMSTELTEAEFISFTYLNSFHLYHNKKGLAPWICFKWLSILIRFPYCLYVCIKFDKIIIYHSEGFYFYLPIFLFFRNKITLQINEIYSVVSQNKYMNFIENLYFNIFNNLIVANCHLMEKWPKKKLLLRGGYFKMNKKCTHNNPPKLDSFIYAGTVDDYKMGNMNILLDLIKTIPDNVSLYLCLLVSDPDYKTIKSSAVNKLNVRIFRNVTNEKLEKFYNNCKYGLVIQDPTKPFNTTSFPSKIFSYLNSDLTPVVQKNKSYINSEVKDMLCFIDDWNWKDIIKASPVNNTSISLSTKLRDNLHSFIYN